MERKKLINAAVSAAIALVAAAGSFYFSSENRPAGSQAGLSFRRLDPLATAANPFGAASAPSLPASERTPREPKPRGVPADVRRVLPALAEMPVDWRTFAPDHILVAVAAGSSASFAKMAVKRESRHTTWIGTRADGATLVAVATEGSWNAVISFPHGSDYTIHIAGRHSAVIASNPDLEACGTDFSAVSRSPAGVVDVASAEAAPVAAAGVYTADVVFFYDEATEAAARQTIDQQQLDQTPAEQIETTIRAIVEQSNQDLERSEVNDLRWSFAGAYKIPAYDSKNDRSMETDLRVFSDPTTEAGKFARDQAVATGADQMVLYITGDRDYAGLAWTPGHQAVVAWRTSHMTLAHEMAHNFGCNHDRQTLGARDNDGNYNYGYRFNDTATGDTGTIMSYAGYRLAYFSNPNVTVDGVALGIPENQPKAAYNARVLRDGAEEMAGYRDAVKAPQITSQPSSVTLNQGGSFSLSVTAVGAGLSYQWYKEDAAVSGATSANYSKGAVTTGDAAHYHVVVSNAQGSVQSNTVMVTVNAVAPGGGSSGGGSSGGGGGGGAPSLWFYGALALLCAARQLQTTLEARRRANATESDSISDSRVA